MSSFSDAFAHPEDPLGDHLYTVAKNARDSVRSAPARVQTAATFLGLLHDVGKATPWFQKHLKDDLGQRDGRSHHSRFGALLAHHILNNRATEMEDPWMQWVAVLGIAKHHGSFGRDLKDEYVGLCRHLRESDAIKSQLDEFDHQGFLQWFTDAARKLDLEVSMPSMSPESVIDSLDAFSPKFSSFPFEKAEDGFDFLTAFGALVGADKLHAAHPEWRFQPHGIGANVVPRYRADEFGEPKKEVDRLRAEIAREVQDAIVDQGERELFTITAPTGSGKTLTGLEAALQLKKTNGRVIYCLPFTSVIDQNSKVYASVLKDADVPVDSSTLLTHHHLTDLTYQEGDEDEPKDDGDLLVETWQSEIVVTTFHQLLYTLFTSRNRNLKRISALQDAVVLMDEVQAIPHRYWESVRQMMVLCAKQLGTRFILMTATMPLIFQPGDATELLRSHPEHYADLARTRLVNRTTEPQGIEDLVTDLLEREQRKSQESIIAILNRRGPVREVYDDLIDNTDRDVAMLSTDLTPRDRRRILDELERPFTLVTTQLIEAGVDISAETVLRDIAPLDSIIQSAGRCNRHGHKERGDVEVLCLVDDRGRRLAEPPYSKFLVESTLEVLKDKGTVDEADYLVLGRDYYEILRSRGKTEDLIEHLANGSVNLLDDWKAGLQLIKDGQPRQAHFIIQSDEDLTIWNRYIEVKNLDDPFERRAAFRKMRREFMECVVNYPVRREPTEEVVPVQQDSDSYDPDRGLLEDVGDASFEIW